MNSQSFGVKDPQFGIDISFYVFILPAVLTLVSFLAGVVLLMLSLRFSVDLSRSDEDRRRLTEEAAILRLQVEDLRRRLDTLEAPREGEGQSH